MAKLTLSDAARVAGVARSTLHRAIKDGRLSRDPDGTVDTAELLRAGYTLQHSTLQRNRSALQDATGPDSALQPPLNLPENLTIHGDEANVEPTELWRARSTLQGKTLQGTWSALQDATGSVTATQHPVMPVDTVPISPLAHAHELVRLERDLLRRELEAAHQREQAALERERAGQEREALLLRLLEHGQQQRLLEVGGSPVTLPAPSPPPGHPPGWEGAAPVSPPAAVLPAVVPTFDPRKYVLGKLCRRQHDYHGTGHSLLRLPSRVCLACDRERARARRHAKRPETPSGTGHGGQVEDGGSPST